MAEKQVPIQAELGGWQKVEKAEYTTRLQVPGGWLYKYEYPWMEHSSSMAFVPDLRNAPTMPPAEDYHHSGVPGDRA